MVNRSLPSYLAVDEDEPKFIWNSLKRGGYLPNEESLLQAIKDNKSRKLVYCAVLALKKYGTQKSLRTLKDLAYYPMNDVQTTSVLTVGAIAREHETAYYAELIDSPKYKDKMFPMVVVWEVGTDEALPAVKRLAEKIIKKKVRQINKNFDPPYIINYLKKYPSDEVDKLVNDLKRFMEE